MAAASRSSSRPEALADSAAAVAVGAAAVEAGAVAAEGSADSVEAADSEAEAAARAGKVQRLRKRNRRVRASVSKDWEYDETR